MEQSKPFDGPTRYLGDQSHRLDHFEATADEYPRKLTPEQSKGLWQKPFDWSSGHPSFFNAMYQVLNATKALDLPPRSTIIEVGSGAGWLTRILAALGYKVHCIEPSSTMIDVARGNVSGFLGLHAMPHLVQNVIFHQSSLERFDVGGIAADGILFFEAFHHLIDERAATLKSFDLLKPGGAICISGDANWLPGNSEMEGALDAEMEAFGTMESPFTDGYLTHLLHEAGFHEVVRHHGINGWFPVEHATTPLRQLSNFPAEYLNNFTARRPLI